MTENEQEALGSCLGFLLKTIWWAAILLWIYFMYAHVRDELAVIKVQLQILQAQRDK
jgi:hypothetical protein